jgi:putative FmdB family regulatory protein
MRYGYRCSMCGEDREVVKSHEQASDPECCPVCMVEMSRIYEVPRLNFATLTQTEKDHLVKYKLETGNDLVCVGNDIAAVKNHTPKMSEYTLPREVEAKINNA